jgi:hypothetical protein
VYIYSFSDAENGTFDKGTSIYDPSKNIIFYDMDENLAMTPDFPERSVIFITLLLFINCIDKFGLFFLYNS